MGGGLARTAENEVDEAARQWLIDRPAAVRMVSRTTAPLALDESTVCILPQATAGAHTPPCLGTCLPAVASEVILCVGATFLPRLQKFLAGSLAAWRRRKPGVRVVNVGPEESGRARARCGRRRRFPPPAAGLPGAVGLHRGGSGRRRGGVAPLPGG